MYPAKRTVFLLYTLELPYGYQASSQEKETTRLMDGTPGANIFTAPEDLNVQPGLGTTTLPDKG